VSFTQQYEAHIDGAFDKVGGGILGNFILDYSAFINGFQPVGNFGINDGLKLAPILFDYTSLPVHEDTVIDQTQRLIFYMDELDNLIELFDSATILPVGPAPVPALGGFGLLCLTALLVGLSCLVIRRPDHA
jgi:hypothetical protein